MHKNKDKVAHLIQAESLNHLDISSPRMTTTQNILKVLAEKPLIYPATGAQLRIKAFYKKYHISSGCRNYSAVLLEKETMAKTFADLQSYSYHYLTARFKEFNPDVESLPTVAGSQMLIICSTHSQLLKIQKVIETNQAYAAKTREKPANM